MDERDKLTATLEKLDGDHIRLLARFAEILVEENRADPIRDQTDVRVRYDQFKRWCAANSIDLAAVEAWAQATRNADGQPGTSPQRAS